MALDPRKLSKLRNNQDLLRSEVSNLERTLIREGSRHGLGSDEEVKDMMSLLLKENKRLNQRVDYILKLLSEATDYGVEEASERMLAAMAKSQIEVLEQLSELQQKIKEKKPPEEQQKTVELLNQKFRQLSDTISHLPYSEQIKVFGEDLKHIENEMKTLEAVVTTEAPDEVMFEIEAVKNSVNAMKTKIDELQQTIKQMAVPKAAPHMAQLDELCAKISSMEVKFDELDQLLQQKKQEVSGADIDKLGEIGAHIREMGEEIRKMEKWKESYPAGDSQQVTFMKQKFQELETEIHSLKETAPEQAILKEIKSRVDSLEKTFKVQSLDRERIRESDIKLIISMLDNISKDVEKIEGKDARHIEKKFSGIEQKTKEMARGLKKAKTEEAKKDFFMSLGQTLPGLKKDVEAVHKQVAEEKPVESTHITELKQEVHAAKQNVKKAFGSEVKPAKVSIVKESLKQVSVPEVKPIEPLAKESVFGAKETLGGLKQAAPAPVKKKIESVEKKVGDVERELHKAEGEVLETKETMREVKEHADTFMITDEDRVFQYVVKMPMDREIFVEDIARDLKISEGDVERALKKMGKEDSRVVLKNIGYGAKMRGKLPTVTKTLSS